jgi:hypothetical protein
MKHFVHCSDPHKKERRQTFFSSKGLQEDYFLTSLDKSVLMPLLPMAGHVLFFQTVVLLNDFFDHLVIRKAS